MRCIGDFSFALSLAKHHKCRHGLLATCYDSEEKVYEKYPQTRRHIDEICAPSPPSNSQLKRKREDDGENDDESNDHNEEIEASSTMSDKKIGEKTPLNSKRQSSNPPKVLFSIDARKLGAPGGGGKLIRNGFPRLSSNKRRRITNAGETSSNGGKHSKGKGDTSTTAPNSDGPWDIISFNFPHVGGLSTDVNRQVRANQELLVSFFKACVPLLSTPSNTNDHDIDEDEDEDWDDFYNENYPDDDGDGDEVEDGKDIYTEHARKPYSARKEPGQIIVTLFEGEPYTLWNIRDLARHAGLRVATSFKFPWSSYPGYSHARTIGEIEGKDGGRGGWKGEDREARSYVFERKDDERPAGNGGNSNQKSKARHGKGGGKKGMNDDSDSD